MEKPIEGIVICVKCKFPVLEADGYYNMGAGPVCNKCGKHSNLVKKIESTDEGARVRI